MTDYFYIAVETISNPGEPSSAIYRVRPLPGQGFPIEMRVECSRDIRRKSGLVFVICAKVSHREGGTSFLYSYHGWFAKGIDREVAENLISEGRLGRHVSHFSL